MKKLLVLAALFVFGCGGAAPQIPSPPAGYVPPKVGEMVKMKLTDRKSLVVHTTNDGKVLTVKYVDGMGRICHEEVMWSEIERIEK